MVKLNISCYIWSSLNSVVWIMVKRLLHSLLPEYESFSSRLLWVPPSVSNGGSALMSWWFLKLQSLCILAMLFKSQSSLFQKWSFFLFSCGMDHIHCTVICVGVETICVLFQVWPSFNRCRFLWWCPLPAIVGRIFMLIPEG